jgi:hypothetical protein
MRQMDAREYDGNGQSSQSIGRCGQSTGRRSPAIFGLRRRVAWTTIWRSMTVISELPQSSVRLKRHIFIGSSVEGLGRAREIAALINDDATECRLWNTTFEPGYTAFDALERMLTECCAAVFIVTPDDKATIRGRTVAVPRANIMLEFGLVAGRLGRHNIAICQYGGAELPSDLKGLTVIEMEPGQPPPCGTESDADGFKLRAEDTLTKWSARLLPTAEMIPRTATVHGYTGRWTFDLPAGLSRRAALLPPDYEPCVRSKWWRAIHQPSVCPHASQRIWSASSRDWEPGRRAGAMAFRLGPAAECRSTIARGYD